MKRQLLALVPAVATATLLCVPATAAQDTAHDPTGDVLRLNQDAASTLVPDRRRGDLVAVRSVHGPRNVTVTMRYAHLSAGGPGRIVHSVGLTTDRDVAGDDSIGVSLAVGPRNPEGRLDFFSPDGCADLTSSVDYTADRVRFLIPRSCLGSPRWVRVGAGSETERPRLQRRYVDDAGLDGEAGGFDWAPGPRIKRG